jgi:hypothetical protein
MDDTGNGRWLTYSELATIRGINRASAVKLVQRERWRRSSGNDRSRIIRVLVPYEWLTPAKETPPDTASVPGMSREDTGMLAALMARAERAEERADEAHKRADVATALADRALAQLADATTEAGKLRGRLDDLGSKLDGAQAELATAQDQNEALRRAEAERRARGVLARLKAAWRGE